MFEPIARPEGKTSKSDWPNESNWTAPSAAKRPLSLRARLARVLAFSTLLTLLWLAIHASFAVYIFVIVLGISEVFGLRFFQRFRKFLTSPLSPLLLGHFRTLNVQRNFAPEINPGTSDFSVSVGIYVEGKFIGSDRGVLGIEGDTVFFAGNACSFLLGSQDIDLGYSFEKYWRSRYDAPLHGVLIRLYHPDREVTLSVSRNDLDFDSPVDSTLTTALKSFCLSTLPTSSRRSYPPLVAFL